MKYWRINTDNTARDDARTCDIWYKFNMAFAGDFLETKRMHDTVFSKLSPGDGIFMHHSHLGIVGYGIVKEEWNGETYRAGERLLYTQEDFEYRIAVNWNADCDCRRNPLPIHGRLPYMGTHSEVDINKWDVHAVLESLRDSSNSTADSENKFKAGNGGYCTMTEQDELEFETPLERGS